MNLPLVTVLNKQKRKNLIAQLNNESFTKWKVWVSLETGLKGSGIVPWQYSLPFIFNWVSFPMCSSQFEIVHLNFNRDSRDPVTVKWRSPFSGLRQSAASPQLDCVGAANTTPTPVFSFPKTDFTLGSDVNLGQRSPRSLYMRIK